MNNRPVFTMGMADYYEGPIEDENWLGIQHGRFPGEAALSKRLITEVKLPVDVAYAEEWKFDSLPLEGWCLFSAKFTL